MTTPEKLTAIRAKCVELLEIAEKRTKGEWRVSLSDNATPHIYKGDSDWSDGPCPDFILVMPAEISHNYNSHNNSVFIASCAGPAEAGWRATIAAIDGFQQFTGALTPKVERDYAHKMLGAIISAWEGLV